VLSEAVADLLSHILELVMLSCSGDQLRICPTEHLQTVLDPFRAAEPPICLLSVCQRFSPPAAANAASWAGYHRKTQLWSLCPSHSISLQKQNNFQLTFGVTTQQFLPLRTTRTESRRFSSGRSAHTNPRQKLLSEHYYLSNRALP